MIIFQNVTKDFGIGAPALEAVSFDIDEGEFVYVTGHSGSGKTTIARLLTKEYIPTEGDIFFAGEPLHHIRRGQIHHHRRRIGVVYQDYKLLSDLTVRENIALALNIIGHDRSEIEQRIADLLDLVQLPEKIDMFPNQLSGGEAQRVAIARALATAPLVLFADEPTGNLDPVTAAHIHQILQKVNELGTTVIMATHDQKPLQGTKHRIFELEKGKIKIKGEKPSKAKPKTVENDEVMTEKTARKVAEKVNNKNLREDPTVEKVTKEKHS